MIVQSPVVSELFSCTQGQELWHLLKILLTFFTREQKFPASVECCETFDPAFSVHLNLKTKKLCSIQVFISCHQMEVKKSELEQSQALLRLDLRQ